ncbi:InlB B-repeat-containing protein [Adhaeribacter radiodurans]|uniref:CotH kinase family protein n=1 Tax=Adhaeribacter radiodurans TaxID=2745197 RepID=A0A7L7L7J7_9BACT|nr:CotH kinase family protein [Adhaeribacter radiodurans]QMU28767.1 CotH kinase family protein [Adhaeribacter radiodurans]
MGKLTISGVGGRGTFVHLYVNGLYWGLYNPVERSDAGMLSKYFGGAYEDWMALDHDGIRHGDPTRFNYLTNTLLNQDLSTSTNYEQFKSYLDVEKFCDYLIVSWMTGMSDWPNNNFHGGNRNVPAEPFRYFAWDNEYSWDVSFNSNQGAWVHPQFRKNPTGTSTMAKIWHAARKNSDFMRVFVERVNKHCFNGGALTDAASRARWAQINNYINTAIIGESARWGDALEDGVTRTRNIHWLPEVNRVDGLMNGNVTRFINALVAEGYYSAPSSSQKVVSFSLMNADTDQLIKEIQPGEVINVAAYTTKNFNIRANTEPLTVGSVKMALSGQQVKNSTETAAPYALFGDNNGNYNNWVPTAGDYTLMGTPYTQASGGGTAGTPLTISFKLVNQPTSTTYNLTVTAANGSVLKSPDQPSYESGSTVMLTATPVTGYQFSGWSGSASGTANPLTITMNVNKSITANFSRTGTSTYSLTVGTTGSGTVTKSPNQASYNSGSNVTLTATPATGYTFNGWSGSATVTTNPLTVTMNGNKNINASFILAPGQQVVSFTLINAATDQPIRTLSSGSEINLAIVKSLNIRANTNPSSVGSVKLVLSGKQSRSTVETGAPYALFGDKSGNYNSWTPATGSYTLKGTAYSAANGGGSASATYTITFTVVNKSVTQSREVLEVAEKAEKEQTNMFGQVIAYPTPTPFGQLQVKLSKPIKGNLNYFLVSATGAKLAAGHLSLNQPSSELSFDFSRQMKVSGVYYLRLEGEKVRANVKLMRQ